MEIISAATLLFLVLDPLGNIPLFLSVMDKVAAEIIFMAKPWAIQQKMYYIN